MRAARPLRRGFRSVSCLAPTRYLPGRGIRSPAPPEPADGTPGGIWPMQCVRVGITLASGASEHRRRTLGVVRILLADDHDIVRHGLRQLLEHESGWEVCGEA